jgi:hypothetical protein
MYHPPFAIHSLKLFETLPSTIPWPAHFSPSCHDVRSNKNDIHALSVMPRKNPPSDKTGPMGVQPFEHGPSPTQMLPLMPGTTQQAKTPMTAKKTRTRTDAVRAALAGITRRNSLRKQREAQNS